MTNNVSYENAPQLATIKLFATLPKHAMSSLPVTDSNATLNLQEKYTVDKANQQIQRIQLRKLADGQPQVYLPTGIALDLNGYIKG